MTGGCEGTPITRNDGNICTDDACVYGICSYTPNGNPGCESGPCPGGCKDGNQCTVDSCDDNICTHTPHSGPCKDGYSCTENDTCSNGACVGTPMDCDDGDPCTYDWCDGTEPLRPGGAAALLKGKCVHDSLCEDSECCKPPCTSCEDYGWLTLVNSTITVSPATVCLGDTITFDFIGVVEDVGGIMRVDCVMKKEIPGVTPTYTWRITKPDGTTEPPSSDPPGSGPTATVAADQAGDYQCEFEATAKRQCAPDPILIDPVTGTAATTATLTLSPSSIPATTNWTAMADYSYSEVTVTWDPPECEGILEIVQVEPQQAGGYLPADEGTLTPINSSTWRYDAFGEPQTTLCPETVKVWIGAIKDGTEITRKSILVQPVHKWWTNGHKHGPNSQTHPPDTADFTNDYYFLRWKYAPVLATTGGAFAGPPSISTNTCVSCGVGLPPPCVPACTHINDSVDFGTSAFTQSENATASTIGHELVHTLGVANQSECTAYTWEFNHDTGTGIFQCDTSYLANVVQMMNCKCNGIGCPD